MEFKALRLAKPLADALKALGYSSPTPIQAKAIPIVLDGHDLMGIAQTGTGKTAAFTLPILNHIIMNDREPPKKGGRVLILAPTRELVSQISEQVRSYGRKMPHLSVASIYGGVSIVRHIKRMSGGADVIVATPGRMIDLLDRGSVKLDDIEILVLDEADQMMDMGFIHALKKIVPMLPEDRQTLLFSATMMPKIKKLAQQFLTSPKTVSVTPPNSTAEKVEQRVTFVNKNEKTSLLAIHLLREDVSRSIVFTRTKHGADRLSKRLRNIGIDSQAIHGNKTQGQRQRALDAFRSGNIDVLIATDVAARGIDIPMVSHVFNYEIPNVPEQYVHRIGRTARAERSGIAHAFVSKDERGYWKDVESLLKSKVSVVELPENFNEQSEALNARPALPKVEAPKPQPRKGRGKSRKKPRSSKSSERSESKNVSDSETSNNTGSKPRKKSRSNHRKKAVGQGEVKAAAQKNSGSPKEAVAANDKGPSKKASKSRRRRKPQAKGRVNNG